MESSTETIVSAATNNVSCDLGDDAAILNLDTGYYYGVNPVGARVWQLVSERKRTVGEIVAVLLEEFDVKPDKCERDVKELINSMLAQGLVSCE